MTRELRTVTAPVLGAAAAVLVAVVALTFGVLRSGGSAVTGEAELLAPVAPAPAAVGAQGAARDQVTSRSASRTDADPGWVVRIATATGIPAPAVRAYAAAQLRLATEQPGCHLGWNTLAGIGWIESHHGTIGDRTLLDDGRSSTTILGPALDGGKFAAIRSSAISAQWHGDTVWEHAVGPLQFIASTWERWGVDGDRDGSADPRDLDDAALTAGRYLCADAHDLSTDSGWNAAVHSYNHDQTYVTNVANAANTYAQRAG